jgi:hypothetical protein
LTPPPTERTIIVLFLSPLTPPPSELAAAVDLDPSSLSIKP